MAGWLLLIHQIPPTPGYLRVKIWRRLQRLGSVPIKNSVYALPQGESQHEDLQWVMREIVAGGGDASIVEARFVDGLSDREVIRLFQNARDSDYAEITSEARTAKEVADAGRLRKRLTEAQAIDFLGAPGRAAAERAVAALEEKVRGRRGKPKGGKKMQGYQGRTWVTREGIKIDRIASAWLIRRFIDGSARFKYVPAKGYRPEAGEVRFDMFEAEFTHDGDRCTFEVLVDRFGVGDRGLTALAEIIHDVDIKDGKFGREEAAGLAQMIAGIAAAHAADDARLQRGAALFDDLYALYSTPAAT